MFYIYEISLRNLEKCEALLTCFSYFFLRTMSLLNIHQGKPVETNTYIGENCTQNLDFKL